MPDASGSSDQSYVTVTFTPPPSFALKFDGLHGIEELGYPFFYTLAMSSGEWQGDVESLVGSTASVKFVATQASATESDLGTVDDAPIDQDDHYVNGIVTRVVSEGLARGSYHYTIELRPWTWLLTQVEDCKIFQNLCAFDIVTKVFRDAGFSDFEDKRQNSAGSTVLEYCVQYRETSFAFVTRLMEEYGIYYYFVHDDSTHKLTFADDPNAHTELSDAIPWKFDGTETRTVADHIWNFISAYSLHSGKYTVRDYNFTTPAADLTAKSIKSATHKYSDFEVYEYPGPYPDTGLGQTLADIRMQAISADRALFTGVSNSRKVLSGWKFKLSQHPDSNMNQPYLIVRSEISAGIGEGMSTKQDEGEKIDAYRVNLAAIVGDTPFKLHRRTRRPMIRGPQTAKVVGPSGEEIYTDQYGRVKVKFYWDRSDASDEERTCWIRVAQPWGGVGWGSMVIPRVGMEVVVEFLEGNPDRPLITGVVYNATQTVPYALPGNKTQSGFKTNSSPGGSGSNELRFEDKAGEEEVFFQAQKDYNKKVLNNETVEITQDTTTTVKQGNRSVTVTQGNESLTVSQGNHSVTVSAGNHSLTISAGKSDVSAATSITLTSGASSVKISPSGVEISGPTIKLTADASLTADGGGSMSLTAGMISIN